MSVLTLVRHGQASFFADDYDRLSAAGEQQSRLLGQFWLEREIVAGRPLVVAVDGPERQQVGSRRRERDPVSPTDSDQLAGGERCSGGRRRHACCALQPGGCGG